MLKGEGNYTADCPALKQLEKCDLSLWGTRVALLRSRLQGYSLLDNS